MLVKAILFDTRSIQKYIFSGDKLKTNIGASFIVDRLFTDVLVEEVLNKRGYGLDKYGWRHTKAIAMQTNSNLKCEVAYIGGGNALILLAPSEDAEAIVRDFSKQVMLKYPGLKTGAAIGELPLDKGTEGDEFQQKLTELYTKLKQNQNRFSPQVTIPYMGITVPCQLDGETADIWDKDKLSGEARFISAATMAKLRKASMKEQGELKSPEEARTATGYLQARFKDILGDSYIFPESLDSLGQIETENYVAVVHIDGNNMGLRFSQCKNLVERKQMSIKVAKICQDSFGKLLETIIQELPAQLQNSSFGIRINEDNSKVYLPIRPLILGGDDVTFVCMGRMALEYTQRFIEFMETNKELPIDCCGGIALIKTSYPFFRGYEMAEQLCGEAKKMSRKEKQQLVKENTANIQCSSWLDFAILHGEQAPELSQLRQQEYQGILGNMHFGPYKVFTANSIPNNKRYDLTKLLQGIQRLRKGKSQSTESMASNKIKDMRSVLAQDKHTIQRFMEQLAHIGGQVPVVTGWEKYAEHLWYREAEVQPWTTPYVDMIEMIDFTDDTLLINDKKAGEACE